ncbi:MmcQ/YjbR family DNA-binding protein [soil metagenome]
MGEQHLQVVREICLALPETTERLSHGEPTFFVGKKVFAMFANNHHQDGHIAVWIPVPAGVQSMLIDAAPQKFFKPPYVGVRGWVGIELAEISPEELAHHLHIAWRLIAPKRMQAAVINQSSHP